MSEFDKPNTGILGRNERREKDTHPEYTGRANMECPHCGKPSDYWLSAWVKSRKSDGSKFFSLSLRAKDAMAAAVAKQAPAANPADDEIPF